MFAIIRVVKAFDARQKFFHFEFFRLDKDKEGPKREWDKYTFGCYGCWVMDDDGNLDYVPEEEYTEELWNEQKKSGERNRAAGLHK